MAGWVYALGLLFEEPNEPGRGELAAIFFAASLFLGFVATGVLGVPGYVLLRRIGWLARRHCFLLGAVTGFGEAALILAVAYYGNKNLAADLGTTAAGFALLTAPLVLTMGALFAWLIRRSGSDVEKIAATFD